MTMREDDLQEMTTTPNREKRQQWIRDHYALRLTGGVWEAVSFHSDPTIPPAIIREPTRALVIREAHREWNHFNFCDEAQAFSEIFPRGRGE